MTPLIPSITLNCEIHNLKFSDILWKPWLQKHAIYLFYAPFSLSKKSRRLI